MNLWGRIAGFFLLALIVFIACQEDDSSLLGYRSRANKFKVSYIEIPLPSSVMTYDSLRTYSDPNQTLERRLLVGRYNDNQFGSLVAEAYTQYGPTQPTVTIPETAEVVSAFLVLSYDFYYYGGNNTSTNTFTVHELLDSIPPTDPSELPLNIRGVANYQPYYNTTTVPYDPTPVGSASFQIDPEIFNKTFDDIKNNPSVIDYKDIDTLAIQLNDDFATRLFNFARGQSDDYKNQRKFRRIFKGFAIKSSISDEKIVGFNPQNDSTIFTKSRLIINYNEIDANTGDKTRKILEYSIYQITSSTVAFGFSNISANRSGTVLASVTTPNVEYSLDNKGYYQSGNPITTKVVFDKFLEFADTIPNVIFNSVEISIDAEDAETFPPPSKLRLRYLNDKNEFVNFYSDLEEDLQFAVYPASMTHDEEGWYIIGQRLNQATVGNLFDINYDPASRKYSGDLTDYFQTLYDIKDEEFRYMEFALSARSPLVGLSTNRLVFNKENIKLKVYYTVPIIDPSLQ